MTYYCPSCGQSQKTLPSDKLCGLCMVPLKIIQETLDGSQSTLLKFTSPKQP